MVAGAPENKTNFFPCRLNLFKVEQSDFSRLKSSNPGIADKAKEDGQPHFMTF